MRPKRRAQSQDAGADQSAGSLTSSQRRQGMEPFVRRSHLLVSARDEAQVDRSWTHGADAVVLDFANTVPDIEKPRARANVKAAIPVAARGGAEVFVRINKELAYADIMASAWPGLTGVVVTGAETAADVEEIATTLAVAEKEHGIANGSLSIIVMLDSGKGVWNVRQIITASPRICSVGLDEGRLCRHLGIVPTPAFDPFVYAKGRVIIEGRAAQRQPVGISHPAGLFPHCDDAEKRYLLALQSKNMGFAGVMCPDPSCRAEQQGPHALGRAAGILPRNPPSFCRGYRARNCSDSLSGYDHD